MTNTISTPLQEATCSFEEVMNLANTAMANMLRQVIAFQQTIFTRPENPGVPTQEELTLQGKLINAIDKLRRFQGRNHKTAGITGFIRFVATKDKNLSKTMHAHYTEFAEKKQSTTTNTQTENAIVAGDIIASESSAVQPSPFRGSEGVAAQPSPSMPVTEMLVPDASTFRPGAEEVIIDGIYSTTPPEYITEEIFNKYKNIIGKNKFSRQLDFVRIENIGSVNLWWLEYNLFQCTLPEAERRFIGKELHFHQNISHFTFQKKLQQHLQGLTKTAA